MWSFFYKLGSPRWFYGIATALIPWLAMIAFGLLMVGMCWGLAVAPPDFRQGNSYRIIFVHVPAAAVSMACYMLMAVAAAISLIWRMKLAEMVMKCCAPIGAALTALALVSGAIWGKPTWGTWWVWDARITSVLILFFFYLGVLALYEAFPNKQTAAKACAVMCLVGVVNLPIIYWSVEWWYSLHQPATIKFTEESTIHPSMFKPLLIMFCGFYTFFVTALLMHLRNEILWRERATRWVQAIVAGQSLSGIDEIEDVRHAR